MSQMLGILNVHQHFVSPSIGQMGWMIIDGIGRLSCVTLNKMKYFQWKRLYERRTIVCSAKGHIPYSEKSLLRPSQHLLRAVHQIDD